MDEDVSVAMVEFDLLSKLVLEDTEILVAVPVVVIVVVKTVELSVLDAWESEVLEDVLISFELDVDKLDEFEGPSVDFELDVSELVVTEDDPVDFELKVSVEGI
jgi:hypothetical protein